jgi:hypothetical protein
MQLEQVPFKIANIMHSVEMMFSEKAKDKRRTWINSPHYCNDGACDAGRKGQMYKLWNE